MVLPLTEGVVPGAQHQHHAKGLAQNLTAGRLQGEGGGGLREGRERGEGGARGGARGEARGQVREEERRKEGR